MHRLENKAVARKLFEEGWNGDLDVLDQILSNGFTVHFATSSGEVLGIAGVRETIADYHAALPGFHCRVDDLIAEGDRVAVRVTYTSRAGTLDKLVILRMADGRIVEAWEDYDPLPILHGQGAQR